MALESGTFISDLVTTNPTASDPKSAGDDHLRLVKSTVKATFPNITGAVTPTHTELNFVDGVTSAIQTQIDTLTSQKGAIAGQTWTGVHAFAATTSIGNVSATEIAYLDGVTSAVQPQIDALTAQKGAISGQSWTGAQNFTGATTTVATPVAPADAVTKAYADGLSFATTLPAQTGNSGKFVTTNGTTASWAFAGISQVTTATTATTLTSTPTLLQITPASYGVTVTLPNATTCSVGGPLHCIDNQGAYPVRVCDSTGALKGFIFAGVVSYISLDNNSTAAGNWAISSNELVGASAQLLTTNMAQIGACVDIGSSRELLVGRNGINVYAVVYDKSSNTFGSVTLVRNAGSGTPDICAILSAANQVLVTTIAPGATAFEAVTLTISGTTITVNTAATATLGANFSAFADGCGLIAVGSSFVTSYTVATPAAQIRALSISGTTVTIGAASVLDGTNDGLIAAATNHVIAVSIASTTSYTKPYLVSGSTLTAGTGTTTTLGAAAALTPKLAALGTRWFTVWNVAGSVNCYVSVISLNATGNGTTTVSSVTVLSGTGLADAIVVGSNKVLVLGNGATNNANILTDTAGTASAGTAITLNNGTTRACLYVVGTNVMVGNGTTTMTYVDCSGASPVLAKTWPLSGGLTSGSNSVLARASNFIFSTAFASNFGTLTTPIAGARNDQPFAKWAYVMPNLGNTFYRGKADSERWVIDSVSQTSITKLECAA